MPALLSNFLYTLYLDFGTYTRTFLLTFLNASAPILSVHEPFRQRIIMNYELPAFTKEEGRSYVLDKLQRAGATRAIFEDAALEAILNASDGTPRIINNLCNSCLLIEDSRKSDMITAEIVMQAINNNEI